LDPIGRKPLDVAGMIVHLGKTIASADALRGGAASPGSGRPTLRTELAGLFNGIDTGDADAVLRARRAAMPLIVRDALGERASASELAHVVESLDALFETDERLTALLVKAVESIRR
jgi:hypothetical protein